MKTKRILIFCPNWIGDVLFSTPVIKALRKENPQGHIACVVVPYCKEMLEDNPYLNEMIIYDQDKEHKSFMGKMRFVSMLRQKEFDQAFILRSSLTRTIITALSKIPVRVGFSLNRKGVLLTHRIVPEEKIRHRSDTYLELCRKMGIKVDDNKYEFFMKQSDREFIKTLLEKEGIGDDDFLVVLNPGGNWEPKRWSKEEFARLADALADKYRAKVCISGSEKDEELAQDIKKAAVTKPVIVCGKTTLKQMGALMERASIVISGDSGPLHIASAVGSNVIALFGPTSPAITGPRGKGKKIVLQKDVGCKIPCYRSSCNSYKCMNAIEVTDILNAVEELR
jgi:lipopolysaccharide heptosyltransferase II